MTLTDRDRNIALAIIPVLLLVGYWFLLMAPKREEAATAAKELTEQQERRDNARAKAQASEGAETNFAADYGEIVRLGKAIPSGVDMPSLIVQLDEAAEGTSIRFTRIATGERENPPAAPAPTTGDSASGTTPTDAGGASAQSAPGGAVENANEAAQTADQRNGAAEQSGVSPADAQTSTSNGGGLPVGGGAATPGAHHDCRRGAPAGLETVPLDMEFVGDFFSLADFFHDVKRFVNVANENVVVNGRLVTIEGVKFTSDPQLFPRITAELKATVYLSPKAQGTTAGATPQGPAPSGEPPTTPASDSPSSTPAPTATATP